MGFEILGVSLEVKFVFPQTEISLVWFLIYVEINFTFNQNFFENQKDLSVIETNLYSYFSH